MPLPLVNKKEGLNFEGSSQEYEFGPEEIQWSFSQMKGSLEDDFGEEDVISCVEFSDDGEFLAAGDKGGRIVVYKKDNLSKESSRNRGSYNMYSTFQSHESELDYLESLEIEKKINKIEWLKRKNAARFLLSTNEKTIKLWKVSEKSWKVDNFNLKEDCGAFRDPSSITTLRVPRVSHSQQTVEASLRKVLANCHDYDINAISGCSDQETYLSSDDLRINLWNFEMGSDQGFNLVDRKPEDMEDLMELITASEFHPESCNIFVYSSSKGKIRLCDMREAALCDQHTKLFDEPEDTSNRSFFSDIISIIYDVKFSSSGRFMISRDFLTIKLWDLHMESKPVEIYPVHEYLRPKVRSLYENDCIYDKFECAWNGAGTSIITGSYNHFFRTFDRNLNKEYTFEASKYNIKPKSVLKPRKVGAIRKKDRIEIDSLNFSNKILHSAWHPKENIIAVAATNNLFFFQDKC